MLNTWRLMWLCTLFLLLACGPAEKKPFCGDGVVNPGEECDDGNVFIHDGCFLCKIETSFCGNGTVDEGEQCEGTNLSGQSCTTLGFSGGVLDCIGCFIDTSGCTLCGNNVLEEGEQCDDGSVNSGDGCSALCQEEFCGDGLVNDGSEQCEDGNQIDTDSCTSSCRFASCGDGFIQAGVEACDDGNTQNGDGCDSNCLLQQPVFDDVAPTQATNLFCQSNYSNSGRKVALDEAGRIYVAMICGASPRAFVVVSNDQGQSYGPPVDIIGNPFFETNTPFEVAVEGGPGNTAYAAVITTDSRLLFTHTVDGGQSWEPPVTLDSGFIAGTGSGLSLVAFGDTILVGINQSIQTSEADGVRIFRNDNRGSGAFASHDSIQHVVFFEVLRDPTTGAIYAVSEEPTMNVRRSTDGGVSFGAESSPPGQVFFSDWALSGNRILVAGSSPNALFAIPLSALSTSSTISGLPPAANAAINDPFNSRTRALTADRSGNTYVLTALASGGVQLDRVLPGGTAINDFRIVDREGSFPSAVALPGGRGAVVVYTKNFSQIFVSVEIYPPGCGDGVFGVGEECDDGNNNDNDGCNAICIKEFCGDGIVNNTDEQCDDGNNNNNDGCRADCLGP